MTSPHDRPDPVELLVAVREFLTGEVVPSTTGALAFKVRVAANALGIVARQVEREAVDSEVHAARLASLGCRSDAELVTRIRAGDIEDESELLRVLQAVVADKVRVTNPNYAERAPKE